VAVFFPVAKLVRAARQAVRAAAVHRFGWIELVGFERREAHECLDGRARRVLAVDGAVDEGLVRIVEQATVGVRIDAVDERIGIVGRCAGERQDRAGRRFERDDRAAP